MIQKLILRRVPHHFPYKVSWLTKGQKTLVNEKAWADFQIGKYNDKILFDIVDIDACHYYLVGLGNVNCRHNMMKKLMYTPSRRMEK